LHLNRRLLHLIRGLISPRTSGCPLGLTPELVHLLRINFVPHAEWVAEVDLLLSGLCREAGDELYEMEPTLNGKMAFESSKEQGRSMGKLNFMVLACLSFCRESTLSNAPETRMNRGGDCFNDLQKGSFCREC
jgi:hypothetical protein